MVKYNSRKLDIEDNKAFLRKKVSLLDHDSSSSETDGAQKKPAKDNRAQSRGFGGSGDHDSEECSSSIDSDSDEPQKRSEVKKMNSTKNVKQKTINKKNFVPDDICDSRDISDDGHVEDTDDDSGDEDSHEGQVADGDQEEEKTEEKTKTTNLSQVDKDYAQLREEIANLPFEDVEKLKQRMGSKLFSQIVFRKVKKKPVEIQKRANRNRPVELPSKHKVKTIKRQLAKVDKKVRDPRFDDLSGEFDETTFKQSYAFIEDIKTREKQTLLKLMSKEKRPEERKKIGFLLNRMKQQEASDRNKQQGLVLKRKIKQIEQKDVATGKTPYFLKKSDQKKLELAEKFRELKKSGKLDQYMSKKRKKLAQKDRKNMPFQS